MIHLNRALQMLADESDPEIGSDQKDHSTHPTVVQYGVQHMLKGKSPWVAAKVTAQKLNGYTNLFISSDAPTKIDPVLLEKALWDYLADGVIEQFQKIKPGKEDYALDAKIQQFRQSPKIRPRLKAIVIEKLGKDPFMNADAEV